MPFAGEMGRPLRTIEDQDSEPDHQPGDHVAERDNFEHEDVDRVQRRPDQVLLGQKLPGDEDGAATLLEQVGDFGFGQGAAEFLLAVL